MKGYSTKTAGVGAVLNQSLADSGWDGGTVNHTVNLMREACRSVKLKSLTKGGEQMGEMRIITPYDLKGIINLPQEVEHMIRPGDSKLIWNPEKAIEVKAARSQFDILVKDGYKAYRTDKKGEKKGGPIKKFDPDAGRLLLFPTIGGG